MWPELSELFHLSGASAAGYDTYDAPEPLRPVRARHAQRGGRLNTSLTGVYGTEERAYDAMGNLLVFDSGDWSYDGRNLNARRRL
jgi:hypothetical protein